MKTERGLIVHCPVCGTAVQVRTDDHRDVVLCPTCRNNLDVKSLSSALAVLNALANRVDW